MAAKGQTDGLGDYTMCKERKSSGMKIGVQISSVSPYLNNEHNVKESFSKVKKIGYDEIQIQWVSPDVSPEFIKSTLDEIQMNCVGTQDYYDVVAPKFGEILKMNELWGGQYICVSRIPDRYRSEGNCKLLASEINKLLERAENSGKTLAFHPIYSDYEKFGGKPLIEILLENCSGKLQICLDLYHVMKSGYDPADWIRKFKGRIPMVHFKDMAISEGHEILVPVGQGILNWDSIFDACLETGVEYCFAEQEQWQKDPFECLGESYDFIVKKIGNM